MGRPLGKKFFKGEMQIVGRIFFEDEVVWVPVTRQHTNNTYSVDHNGVTKRFKIVVKPVEELAANEMVIMGRNPAGEVNPVKWIKRHLINYNEAFEQWYVVNDRNRNGDIEIESVLSKFIDPSILIPGPLDIIVPTVDGFNTLSETFQLAAPDIIVGMAGTVTDKTGPITVKIKHGGEELKIVDMSQYGSVLTLIAVGTNMTVEEADLTVEVTGATLGYGGLRVNEMNNISEDLATWKRSVATHRINGPAFWDTVADTPGVTKMVIAANSVIRHPVISSPAGYKTTFASRIIEEGPVTYKLEDINHSYHLISTWDVDDDGWATIPLENGLATFSSLIVSDFFKNNNNIAVKLKIKTTLPRTMSCSFIGLDGTRHVWNDDIEPYENFEGEIYLFAGRGTQGASDRFYIGMQPGMSFNVYDLEFIPDSKIFSWMFTSGSEETKGKQFLVPSINFTSDFCYNLANIDGEDYIE